MNVDQKNALEKYYYVEDKAREGKWHFLCRSCDEAWSLPKDNRHPGNFLHLLNHGRSHDHD